MKNQSSYELTISVILMTFQAVSSEGLLKALVQSFDHTAQLHVDVK